MVDTGSPYRDNFAGRGRPGDDNVDHFMQDYKEKKKLLVRWQYYFPHENVKEFDVSLLSPP
jgi:hypothetical protein